MSVISNSYDVISSRLSSLYSSSTYRQLTNPREAELNDTLTLARGYGFYIGAGFNTKRTLSGLITIERNLVVVNSIVQRGTDRDITIRDTAEKQILEDQFIAIESFHGDSLIGPIDVEYSGDEGIEYIFLDQKNYLYIRSTYRLLYEEQC